MPVYKWQLKKICTALNSFRRVYLFTLEFHCTVLKIIHSPNVVHAHPVHPQITGWTVVVVVGAWFEGAWFVVAFCAWKRKEKWGNRKKTGIWPVTRGDFIMRPFLIRCPGRLITGLGSFSICQNKPATQVATAPRGCFQRHMMHYQTEERGHPNCTDYRIYFSKFSLVIIAYFPLITRFVVA